MFPWHDTLVDNLHNSCNVWHFRLIEDIAISLRCISKVQCGKSKPFLGISYQACMTNHNALEHFPGMKLEELLNLFPNGNF